MCIHLFAFRWNLGVTEEQKQRAMVSLRDLQGQIPGLLETRVGKNFSRESHGYELGGVMQFADQTSLEAYFTHPVHLALVNWLRPLIDPLEIDFIA